MPFESFSCFFMTLMIFHFEFSYHVSPRVLGSATDKKIFGGWGPYKSSSEAFILDV